MSRDGFGADNAPLSKTQRRILFLMREHGSCYLQAGKGSRRFHHGPNAYGYTICAYQNPEIFLERRGLIERAGGNLPRGFWKLTAIGAIRASRIREYPR